MGKVNPKHVLQLVDGVVTIATELPRQLWRGSYLVQYLPLGDDMNKPYYYQVPQLYKMPSAPSYYSPSLPRLGEYKEGSLTKALPYIAGGIAALVVYNIIRSK